MKKYVEEAGIVAKWESSAWAKKRVAAEKRRTLSDFERFQVMIEKKSRRDKVRKPLRHEPMRDDAIIWYTCVAVSV